MPNSIAVQQRRRVDRGVAGQPAATTRRGESSGAAPGDQRGRRTHATSEPTTAMLKQFAPIAVMPPSPKKNAWMTSAIEMARIDAHGPSTTAASPRRPRGPVVPPGSGMLNIITTNENAAKSESSGHEPGVERRRTRRSATYQNGAAPA